MPVTISFYFSLLSPLGRQYLGQVLSSLLRKPAAGITVGDVITEIACKDTNVTLLPSLKHGKHFSSRPLVSLDGLNGTSRIGQVLRDGNVYMGVRLIEKFLPGRVLSNLSHLRQILHFSKLHTFTLRFFNLHIISHLSPGKCIL